MPLTSLNPPIRLTEEAPKDTQTIESHRSRPSSIEALTSKPNQKQDTSLTSIEEPVGVAVANGQVKPLLSSSGLHHLEVNDF
jgi:hypothetical protein